MVEAPTASLNVEAPVALACMPLAPAIEACLGIPQTLADAQLESGLTRGSPISRLDVLEATE